MRVNLLQPEGIPTPTPPKPSRRRALEDDLELRTLYAAMASGDEFIREVCEQLLPSMLTDPDTIAYRQRVLSDCLANPHVLRDMYAIATEAVEGPRRRSYAGFLFLAPEAILHRSIERLELLLINMRELRALGEANRGLFGSVGFTELFATPASALDDAYLARIEAHLHELRFPRGVLFSAGLGTGNKGTAHMLHRSTRRSWRDWFATEVGSGVGFTVAENDEVDSRALIGLSGQGINAVATTMSSSADHVQGFFARLRAELAFYLGCVNLRERLVAAGAPITFPVPTPPAQQRLRCRDLRDAALYLTTSEPVVGNEVAADGASLIMVTGANAGGKSTFLRSLGTAQLMMQAGMFVVAESFRANLRDEVFTHFKREEDSIMRRGKLDDELARMSDIADRVGPHALLLCNESFASTNEREGSRLARQVVRAMTEAGVKLVYVTHLYELAHSRFAELNPGDVFLKAQRRADASRSFRLVATEPEPTDHGEDSFRRIFTPEPIG